MSAPADWHLEVWNVGATAQIGAELVDPSFTAPATVRKNSVGTFSFDLQLDDAQALNCRPEDGREVRLYRGASWAAATWRWAGRIWQSTAAWFPGASVITFSCFSLADYFRDRYIDKGAVRVNLLANGDFESGLTSWAANLTTATVIASDHVAGTHAVQLVYGVDDDDSRISQDVSFTAGSEGDIVTVAAWVKVTAWTGPALGNFGLTIVQLDGMGNVLLDADGVSTSFHSADVNYQTRRGQWIKLTAQTTVPASTTVTLRVSLYSPNGTVEWDAVWMGLYESLSLLNHEQASIAANVVAFLQNSANFKNDLHIATSTPSTGINRDRTYQFADHVSGETALSEFPRLVDGFDWEVTPARTFTTHALPAGIGTDKTATVTLVFAADETTTAGACQPVRVTFDGPQAASDVTTLGNGGGPEREEGGAVDNTRFGGVTVQQILPAPSTDTKVDTLVPWAQRQLAVYKDPTVFEVVVTDRELGFTLSVGDRVTLSANLGYIQESGHAQVVSVSADPNADFVTLTLNRAA